MKFSYSKFTLINLSLTLSIVLLLSIFSWYRQGEMIFWVVPPIIIGLLTQIGFYFLNIAIKKEKNNEFMNFVLISTFIRLIIGILANVLVILLWKSQSVNFILSYFFSYFLLTFFEIYAVISNLRANSKDKK